MKSDMPVIVYAEATPNPDILKFVINFPLLSGSVEFLNPAEASDNAIASHLFSFPQVKSVFIAANFISITKDKSADWYELIPELRSAIIKFYTENGKPSITEEKTRGDEKQAYNAMDTQIMNILTEYVQPAVAGDGGEIVYKSFKEGTVTLELKGACRGCPSSTFTLKSGIENLLKQMVPEVKEVVAEQG